jgi:hypothetical protein
MDIADVGVVASFGAVLIIMFPHLLGGMPVGTQSGKGGTGTGNEGGAALGHTLSVMAPILAAVDGECI